MSLLRLSEERFDEVVDVFCDAFYDYPVMRYVIGNAGADYDRQLRKLIAYFTMARFCRGYPVLGIAAEDGKLVAAANINPPRGLPAPPALKQAYADLSEALGPAAISRYEAFAAACSPFEPEHAHFHLGMIGVAGEQQGRGHARRLLEAVQTLSHDDPESNGVSLTTETPRNLPFYEHFGYRILGFGKTPDAGLQTWTLFRPDDGR